MIVGFILLFVNIIDQSASLYQLLHKVRECLPLEAGALCAVVDHTTVEINLYLIASFDSLGCFRAFDDWHSDIDCIAVENAGLSLWKNEGN